VAVGLFGAALIYGDGAITPAISVLSRWKVSIWRPQRCSPMLFPPRLRSCSRCLQSSHRERQTIGHFFGPVMLVWFVAIATMGIWGIVQHPSVFAALNPVYRSVVPVLARGQRLLGVGRVFLCVTGAEALYADMGHFGRGPIKLAWFAIVFPSLILNYAGQAALVLEGAPTDAIFSFGSVLRFS